MGRDFYYAVVLVVEEKGSIKKGKAKAVAKAKEKEKDEIYHPTHSFFELCILPLDYQSLIKWAASLKDKGYKIQFSS